MKKSLFFTLALIGSFLSLCSAIATVISDNNAQGSVHFEAADMPALNFSIPLSRAAEIYRLMPDSVADVCRQDYIDIRNEFINAKRSAKINYDGVNIRCTGADPALQFVFTVPGYKLTVSDVSWEALDRIFIPEQ